MAEQIWSGWELTEEQRQKMIAGDRTALDKFYFDNLKKLEHYAHCYGYKKRLKGFGDLYEADDLLQDTYINLPRLNFESPGLFCSSLNQSFYWSIYGGMWSNPSKEPERLRAKPPLYIFDSSPHENEDDVRGIDKYLFSPSPYQEIMAAAERHRLSVLEKDLDIFLKEMLTEKQFVNWKMGHNRPDLIIKLRKNADKIIAFLQAHGTPAYKLKGEPLEPVLQTDKAMKAKAEAARQLRVWQESHLDELDPKTRRLVQQRINCRKRQKVAEELKKKRKAEFIQDVLNA